MEDGRNPEQPIGEVDSPSMASFLASFAELDAELDRRLDALEAEHGRFTAPDIDMFTVPALQGITARGHREALAEVERELRRLEAERAAIIASAERQNHHLIDGHRSVAAWVRATVTASVPASYRLTARARLLAEHPPLDAALRQGRIGVEHVDTLAHYSKPDYAAENLADYLPTLLDAADRLDHDGFTLVVRHWQLRVDPGTPLDADQRAHRERHFRVRQGHDGAWAVKGSFASADGAVIDELFDRFLEAENLADWDAARALKGDLATTLDLPRTLDQRRADAFLAMVRHAARPDVGAEPEPLVNLVADARTLLTALGTSLGEDDAAGPHWWLRRLCGTTTGHAVSVHDVIAAALVGKVRTLVVDDNGVITHVGRTQRFFSKGLLDAVGAIAPRCIWPGCTTERTQGDHMHPFSEGGGSDPDNVAPLCGHHNRWRHRRGYRVVHDDLGLWRILRPDGTEVGRE